MAKRTVSQRIGASAETFVFKLFDEHPNWVARNQDRDFGIDLEVELADYIAGGQQLIGKLLKIQVKGSENLRINSQAVAVKINRDYLDYVDQFRVPVILVVVDTLSARAWFLWLQDWILQNEVRLKHRTEAVTVHIPIHQTLQSGLDSDLVYAARGETKSNMIVALRDLISAASLRHEHALLSMSLDMLKKIDDPYRTWSVDLFIDTFVKRSVPHWQWEEFQYKVGVMIMTLGDLLTLSDIKSLTVKDSEKFYARSLNYIQTLYDYWWDHAILLGLPEFYKSINFVHLNWYCLLRESYPGVLGHDIRWKFIIDPTTNSRFGTLELAPNHDLQEHERTRGDNVYLPYLRPQQS